MENSEARHEAGKREVEMYIRTFHTLLRSSGEVGLKALVQAHYNIDSSLHPDARSSKPDLSAFIYSVLRLPDAVLNCQVDRRPLMPPTPAEKASRAGGLHLYTSMSEERLSPAKAPRRALFEPRLPLLGRDIAR